MKGTVIDWDNNCGHIRAEDGHTYYTHGIMIQSQDRDLNVDEVVTFDVGKDLVTKRPIAVMVQRGVTT